MITTFLTLFCALLLFGLLIFWFFILPLRVSGEYLEKRIETLERALQRLLTDEDS